MIYLCVHLHDQLFVHLQDNNQIIQKRQLRHNNGIVQIPKRKFGHLVNLKKCLGKNLIFLTEIIIF